MEDENSILNYYKQAMKLRNMFPSIARGEVKYYPENQNNYICVITKTYEDEKITIVFNLDSFEQEVKLNVSELGFSKVVGELYATNEGNVKFNKNGNLTLPPYSIVILQ